VEYIQNHAVDPDFKVYNNPALCMASSNNLPLVVSALIKKGADLSTDRIGYQAVWKAAASEHLDCVKVLVDAGADVNTDDKDFTPLIIAAFNGQYEMCEYLIV